MTLNQLGKALRELRDHAEITNKERNLGHKRMTQELLGSRFGWSTAAHISEIETGKRLPTPDTLKRWVEECGGTHSDLHYVNGLAGNVPITRFPPSDELISLLESVANKWIEPYPYPAYIVDFRNIIWVGNSASSIFYGSYQELKMRLSEPQNLFRALFDSRLPVYQMFDNLEKHQIHQILYFKSLNDYRRHEPFYLNYVEWFARELLPTDARTFRDLWEKYKFHNYDDLTIYHSQLMTFRIDADCVIRFSVHDESIKRFGELFAVIRHVPDTSLAANLENIDRAVTPYSGLSTIKLWELIDINQYLSD